MAAAPKFRIGVDTQCPGGSSTRSSITVAKLGLFSFVTSVPVLALRLRNSR